MANTLAVQLVITGDTGNLQANLKRIQDQLAQINGGGGGIGGAFAQGSRDADTFQQSLRGLIGRFSALWAVMKSGEGIASVFNTGIKFNAAMEDARLGIGALITAQAKLTDGSGRQLAGQEALNTAMYMGNEQIQKLRISGLQTAATTEQLVSAYQDAVGGGLRAGMSLDQVRRLTVQTVQAAGAMGVPMNQLNQEIRSILDGTIDRNSRVAIRLGITNADVEKWKSAGTLFSELNKRMAAFSEAGKESMNNWTTLLSNMAEAGQILMGESFKMPMKNIQGALDALMKTIVNINTAQISDKVAPLVMMLKDLGNVFGDFTVGAIRAVSNAIMNMGIWWEKNREAITGVLASFKVFMGDALSFVGGVAVSFIRFAADSFLWFTKLPEPIKTVGVALAAFTVAMWAANSSMAGGVASAVGPLIQGIQKLGFVLATATSGSVGFQAALTAFGGPVTWIVGLVAALGAGIYYLATESARASKNALELRRQYVETIQSFQQLLPTLKDIDSRMKEKIDPKDTEAIKARNELRMQGIQDLIKFAPAQAEFIKKEIEAGTDLATVWLKVAGAKKAALEADLAAQKVKTLQAGVQAQNDTTKGKVEAVASGIIPGLSIAYALRAKASREAHETEVQNLEILQKAVDSLGNQINLEKVSAGLSANKVEDAKKLAQQARQQAAADQLDLLVEKSKLDAMARQTNEQKQQYEIAKVNYELGQERERIEKLAAVAKKDPTAALKAVEDAAQRERLAIIEKYAALREDAELRLNNFLDRQDADALSRRKKAIAQELDARLEAAGKTMSQAQKDAIIEERFSIEVIAAKERDIKKLEAALTDLAKVKGHALSFDEQKAALDGLAEKLKISTDAVAALKLKIDETQTNRQDWFGGFKAGLQEVADTVINKFELMRNTVRSVADGMKQAFASAITGMLNGTMTLSQGLKSLWKGIVNTIISALAEIIAKFIVAGIANMILGTIMTRTSQTTALAQYQLAVMESWAAYAGIPYVGWALALAQIGMITATYVATMGMSAAGAGNPTGAGEATASTGMNYPGYAEGGLITKAGFVAEVPGNPELVAPEKSFLDWIRNVANPALGVPRGGFARTSEGELAYAGMSNSSSMVHASFDGAMIVGDSADGLRKAANALRVIRVYDERTNG